MDEEKIARAEKLLRKEFGTEWRVVAETLGLSGLTQCIGKDLTSFMAFPSREEGGKNIWRGNCSPEVIRKIVNYVRQCIPFRNKEEFLLLDPMCGSGTSGDVAKQLGIQAAQYDLNPQLENGVGGWNALKDEVKDNADLVFLHPPYHSIIRYSGNMWGKPHPDDLSRCETYDEFIEKLNMVIKKLFFSLRRQGFLAVLVGDIRQQGEFHSIADDMMTIGKMKSWIVKGQFHCISSRRNYHTQRPFIPIVTEHLVLFQKEDCLIIPFSYRKNGKFYLLHNDSVALTWFELIRSVMESRGGVMSLQELYEILQKHPKAQKNKHYRERIRACIYEHKTAFQTNKYGYYRLKYQV